MSKEPIAYLSRRATFSASHRLHSKHLSDEENRKIFGKCNHPSGHGHNYVLEVVLRGEINSRTGLIFNLTDLKAIMDEKVIQKVDHRHLNLDVQEFKDQNPTAEVMAKVFWEWIEPELPTGVLYEIRLHETENNVAIYRGE
jgi:6-pyruvoyltetrahydropterin/6-carboxytetrahydropterin synthase